MRVAFKIAIVLILVAILVGGILFYTSGQISALLKSALQGAPVVKGPISFISSATPTSVYSFNNSHTPLVYSLLSYSAANASNATVAMDIYLKNPIAKIYLLNVSAYCVSCFNENVLQSDLQSDLQNYDLLRNGTSFSYVNQSHLASLPANSIIVIPSGLIPIYIVNGTSPVLLSLLQKGDIIVYAGLNLSRSVGPNGLIFVNSQQTMNQLGSSDLGTGSFLPGINQTSASAVSFNFSKPTFVFSQGSVYENETYVNSGNGTVVAFSNYPTSSWTSASVMAGDISKAIATAFWLPEVGQSTSPLNLVSKSSGNFGVFAAYTGFANRTNSSRLLNGSYSIVTVTVKSPKSVLTKKFVSQNFYVPKGSINVAPSIGATQNIPILMQVFNATPNLLVHLDLYDRNLSYVGSIPIGFINNQLGIVKYHAFLLPSGYYVVALKDFSNNYYGSALFYLAPVNITPTSLDFVNGTFAFSAYSDGVQVNNASYSVNINNLYEAQGQINNGAMLYTLPKGTLISYGTEHFNFNMFGNSYTYIKTYAPNVVNIPPIYIEFGIAAIVVILLNLILKPPNRDEYYIDVPAFPPSKREKVKVQASTVLGIFDKVNYYHRWKYMPLTADELKQGIANNIRINSMPISITMQNTNGVLSLLTQDGSIVGIEGYYAPKAWVEASSHSIEYLTVFRKLRDYCVSHAILFTDLDSSDVADMLITKEGRQMSLFIYTESSKMKQITLSRDSKVGIVFLDDDSLRSFTEELYESYGKEAEVLKLGIEYNYVKLVDSEHTSQLVL